MRWCNPTIITFLYVGLSYFVEPWFHGIRTGALHLTSAMTYRVSYWANLLQLKTHTNEAVYVSLISFQISQHVKTILKS